MNELLEADTIDAGWYSNEAATFGDRVAGAREAAGLSQEQLAKRLGVKLKTLRSWENDLGEPQANKLQMLSGVMNVSLTWLLNGEGDGLAGPGSVQTLDADVTELFAEMRQLKASLNQSAERLASLEKRLRHKLTEQL